MHRIHKKIQLPIDIDQAWSFFSNPGNLRLITPDWLNMKVTTSIPEVMYPGMIISYQVSPMLGIPLTWVTEITQVKEGEMFVDEQRYGPYRMWHHQHFFRSIESGVEVEDIVDYILPFGPLGKLVHLLHVKRQVSEIFAYRESVLKEKYGIIV